ncbi:MAG: hypothetical protein GX442_04955 [Candidatus Riflebacteria bacterium]|nr:hypothetical protein [Candidatus Riflebacteria bacterium]
MSSFSRKHYLVLPSYQVRLVGFLILVVLLGSMLHGFFLYRITARTIEEGFFSAHNRLRSTWEILKPAIIVTNGMSFLLISLALLVVTTLTSHRLIGPVVKIAGRVRDLATGRLDLPPLRLRKGDEGKILSEAVNQLHDEYRRRLRLVAQAKTRLEAGQPMTQDELRGFLGSALDQIALEPPAEPGTGGGAGTAGEAGAPPTAADPGRRKG